VRLAATIIKMKKRPRVAMLTRSKSLTRLSLGAMRGKKILFDAFVTGR